MPGMAAHAQIQDDESAAAARPSIAGRVLGSVAGAIADLFSRIVNGIKRLAPVALAVGCQGPRVDKTEPAPAAVVEKHAEPERDSDDPKPLGKFDVTFYYVVGEEEVAAKLAAKARKAANDNKVEVKTGKDKERGDREAARSDGGTELAAIAGTEMVPVYDKDCSAITEVSKEFASQLALQGTGKLRDGRVLNVWGNCGCERSPCFKVTENQWGTAGTGKPLQPFRTVAVDRKVIKLGSLLYVPLLEGRTMPGRSPWGGYIHDGCVVADDTGGGIDGYQLDLFVGRKAYFLGLSGSRGSHSWARNVPVFDGSKICERKGRKIGRKSAAI